MKIKDSSVKVPNNQYTAAIQFAVESVYKTHGLEPTCTSGNDGAHSPASLHYVDRALDIRFWDLLNSVANEIKKILPEYYDVVVEKDHFHIEADIKKEIAWNKKTSTTSRSGSTSSKS